MILNEQTDRGGDSEVAAGLDLWHLTVIFVLQADGETAVLVAGDPEREHMRKVRQDGGIRYHVNLLQAMVSIHKRLSAGKLAL